MTAADDAAVHAAASGGLVEVLLQRVRRVSDPANLDIEKVRVVIADALVVARSADGTAAARTADALSDSASTGAATALGTGRRIDASSAVLANSLRIHALLQDDAHPATMLHPAAVVLPVALALVEDLGVGNDKLIAAVAAGYETMAVLGAPVAADTAGRGLRNTTVFGPAGAAVAAALLLGLDDDRLKAAAVIACGLSGGTLAPLTLGSPDWRMQPGMAAVSGLAAARYAAALDRQLLDQMRFDAIEAPGGLYATLTGSSESGWRDAVAATGSPAIHDVTHKQHATCGANQVPVAALSDLLRRTGADFEGIAGIEVALTATALGYPGTEDYGPFGGDGVYMSRPLALAAVALRGRGPLTREVLEDALADSRLERAVSLVVSRATDAPGEHPQAASVTLELRDGRVVSAGIDDVDPASLAPSLAVVIARLRGQVSDDRIPTFSAAIDALPGGVPADIIEPLFARTEAAA